MSLLERYNRANDTQYRPIEHDALTLSFMRIFADMENNAERASGGTASGGTATLLDIPGPGLDALYAIRFTGLSPNRRHYIRAKTVLTISRGAPGQTVRSYSYVLQVADNEDFLDAIEFIAPPLVAEDPINSRRAESQWVYIELDTGYYDGEYDGVHRPEQYPLPERDWEVTYDALTQTLQWRFRTNQRGADGRPDQNVDQRFISRLISERTFIYTIDVSQHNNMPVTNRVVEIPVSIIRAFNERSIALEIKTDSLSYTVPPGAFDTAAVRGLQQSHHGNFRISISGNPTGMPSLQPNTRYAAPPQRLSVTATTPDRSVTMDTFARPLTVALAMDNHITPTGANTGLFQSGNNISGWQDMNGQFSFSGNALRSQTSRPATFAGISRTAPPTTTTNNQANNALQRVTSRMTITDLTTFAPSREVSANEFNNIVNALTAGRTTVTIGAPIPDATTRQLTNARLLAPQNLTREAAMDIMVRLYENRTRQILSPMTSASSVPGMQNSTPALQRNLRIAADLGFITGPLEPRGRLTMGELMNMVDIVIQDAGM